MKKLDQIKEIQKRLPENLKIVDETNIEFTDDEFLSILCWIKYFNNHYEKYEKTELPFIKFPIISKRIQLDFGLYHFKSDCEPQIGNYNIYIMWDFKNSKGKKALDSFINNWDL